MRIVLKRTKKKPVPGFDLDSGKVAYKYLYTDTGEASRWSVAIKFVVEKGEPVPEKLILDLNVIDPLEIARAKEGRS